MIRWARKGISVGVCGGGGGEAHRLGMGRRERKGWVKRGRRRSDKVPRKDKGQNSGQKRR